MPDSSSLLIKSSDPDRSLMQRAYRYWAPVYDVVCGGIFAPHRRHVVALACMAGREALEIGVGTGLSLGDYDPDMVVSGIDVSPEMIAKARRRAASGIRAKVGDIAVMDATDLSFPDRSFDVVLAQFLITLVPDPEAVLGEAWRVLRPGGALFLVNHFQSDTPAIAAFETRIAPALHGLGLRPDFPFARISNWAGGKGDLSFLTRTRTGPFGCFSIVRINKAG